MSISYRTRGSSGERGVALIIAVLCLAAISALTLSTLSSSGVDMAAARASAGALGRTNCLDQIARYAMEQLRRQDVLGVADAVNNRTCNSAGLAWVNFDVAMPDGGDGISCIGPTTRSPCPLPPPPPGDTRPWPFTMSYPPSTPPDPHIECRTTRAIVTVAPTPFTPGGSLVGQQVGEGNATRERRVPVRLLVATLPKCATRYANDYLDVAEVETILTGEQGELAN